MKVLGTALLALSGLLFLPFVLNIVRPLWWNEWFGNPEAAPSPSELGDAIVWAERSAYAAVAVALIGLAMIGFGRRCSQRDA